MTVYASVSLLQEALLTVSVSVSVHQEALRQLGGLDVLVLNHIVPHPLAPWGGSPGDLALLQTLLDVNLRSYVHLASAALPWLRTSSGSVIVMSSVAGESVFVVCAPSPVSLSSGGAGGI